MFLGYESARRKGEAGEERRREEPRQGGNTLYARLGERKEEGERGMEGTGGGRGEAKGDSWGPGREAVPSQRESVLQLI